MIYTYEINGLPVQTGDIICTTDGGRPIVAGEFWRMLGKLVPGDVDHVAMYIGPNGLCVESAVMGVYAFEVPGPTWDSEKMHSRRLFLDTFYGVAYPLKDKGLPRGQESKIRADVAAYCLKQASANKSYNLNFLDSQTEDAFYCSQLVYKAYLPHGIDLNTRLGVPNLKGTESIIFPQEIWTGCRHRRAEE
jgi:uncharacterized protein YycO